MEDLQRIAYGAQGIKLPPRKDKDRPAETFSDRLKVFASEHNVKFAAKQRAARKSAK